MDRPTIVCLCGSTRFSEAYQRANLTETLAGRIVLTIGCDMRADADLFAAKTDAEREEIKAMLDELHKRKIDMADEILVLNVGGYVGSSTKSEILYAYDHQKRIRWLEQATCCDADKHRWEKHYYGDKCGICGMFVPDGCGWWMPQDDYDEDDCYDY